MDDDAGPGSPRRIALYASVIVFWTCLSLFSGGWDVLFRGGPERVFALAEDGGGLNHAGTADPVVALIASLPLLIVLLAMSAFFSGSEVAFFSIHKLRLKGMAGQGGFVKRRVAAMMEHPNRLLTTILVGNMIANISISVVMPPRVEQLLEHSFGIPVEVSYPATVLICTVILVFFGEICPKVFAVRVAELYACAVAFPLTGVDLVLGPVRWAVLRFTDFTFRITRFNDIKAAPFITDEEFKSVLSYRDVEGVIEEEDRQMIEGILDFGDAQLREILVPRPAVAALPEDISIREALDFFRERGFSRIPLYRDDLDHVTGVLFAKDLLPSLMQGHLDAPVTRLARTPNFVPITMTARGFVRDAQRMRMHLAIVVDEYGGTEGIVTLEDAIEEVVGDIRDAETEEGPQFEDLGEGRYRVDGSVSLDDLSDLIGIPIQDDEHETLAGFIMSRTSKIPAAGDRFEHEDAVFTVENIEGKRVAWVRIEVPEAKPEEDGP